MICFKEILARTINRAVKAKEIVNKKSLLQQNVTISQWPLEQAILNRTSKSMEKAAHIWLIRLVANQELIGKLALLYMMQ